MSPSKKRQIQDEMKEWYKYFLSRAEQLRGEDTGNLVGKYFVIREGEIVGTYDRFDTAYKASIEQYTDHRFIIQQLLESDQPELILVTA